MRPVRRYIYLLLLAFLAHGTIAGAQQAVTQQVTEDSMLVALVKIPKAKGAFEAYDCRVESIHIKSRPGTDSPLYEIIIGNSVSSIFYYNPKTKVFYIHDMGGTSKPMELPAYRRLEAKRARLAARPIARFLQLFGTHCK